MLRPQHQYVTPTQRRATISDHLWGVLWAVFIVASIFYVFQNGTPQPGDYMMAVLALLVFVTGNLGMPTSFPPVLKAMMWFVLYVCLVNTVWFWATEEVEFLFTNLFYLFNFTASVVFWSLYRKLGDLILIYTAIAVITATATEAAILITNIGGLGYRNTGSFNNPNQLSHFAILMASMAAVMCRSKRLPTNLTKYGLPSVFLIGIYLTIASLSRAGLLVYLLAVFLGLLQNLRFAFIVCLAALGLLLLNDFTTTFRDAQEKVLKRFERGNAGLDHVEEFWYRNGSQRISNYPQYLILGSGEGFNRRFSRHCMFGRFNYELHSTHATILMSYGFVGFFLAFRIVWALFKRRKSSVIFLLPVMAFGFNHNGIRQTEFWLLFLLIHMTIESIEWKRWRRVMVQPPPPVSPHDPGLMAPGQFRH